MIRWSDAVLWLARIVVGSVLVYSGMVKLARPYEFLNSVFQYRMLGPEATTIVAATLPFLEVAVGAAIVCGVYALGASGLASVLFLAFVVAQTSTLVRGLHADCGCLGFHEPVSPASILRTLGLLVGAVFYFFWTAHRSRDGRAIHSDKPCSTRGRHRRVVVGSALVRA